MGTLKRFPNPPATDSAGGPGCVHMIVMGTLKGFPNPPATDSAGGPGSVHTVSRPYSTICG